MIFILILRHSVRTLLATLKLLHQLTQPRKLQRRIMIISIYIYINSQVLVARSSITKNRSLKCLILIIGTLRNRI
jgi:hypothetical protein